jgi:RHS repeat-associated protein
VDRSVDFGTKHSESFFTYDIDGMIETIRHEDKNGNLMHPQAELAYTRDAGGRIASITQTNNVATMAYDMASRLIAVTNSNPSVPDEGYAFDELGNRLSSHRFTGSTTIAPANHLAAAGDFTYSYNPDGQLDERVNTVSGEVTRFEYNHRGRLILATVHPSAVAAATTAVRLAYDFRDRIMSREINGTKTWILYDRTMPLGEFADGAPEVNAVFVHSLDRVDDVHLIWREGVGIRFMLKDHIGSVRGTLDGAGNFLSWVDYDAFGNLVGTPPVGLERTRYAGRYYYDELGLYENRMRFYDPNLGRFTAPDPIHIEGGDLNLYAYVGNNPLLYTDPQGTSAAQYASLNNLITYYVVQLCNLGNCVGQIYGGVVESAVNLQPPKNPIPIQNCSIDLLPGPPICASLSKRVKTKLIAKTLGGGAPIKTIVDSCKKVKIESKPPPSCDLQSF